MKKLLILFILLTGFLKAQQISTVLNSAELQFLSQSCNNKQDSMLNATNNYTVMTFTVVSTNTGVATVSGQVIGVGGYTFTLPTGTWQLLSVVSTQSVNSSTFTGQLRILNGGTGNLGTTTEGNGLSITAALATEWKDTFTATTTNYLGGGTAAYNMWYPVGNTSVPSGGGMYSGAVKIGIYYNSIFTPSANNQYMMQFRFKRIY